MWALNTCWSLECTDCLSLSRRCVLWLVRAPHQVCRLLWEVPPPAHALSVLPRMHLSLQLKPAKRRGVRRRKQRSRWPPTEGASWLARTRTIMDVGTMVDHLDFSVPALCMTHIANIHAHTNTHKQWCHQTVYQWVAFLMKRAKGFGDRKKRGSSQRQGDRLLCWWTWADPALGQLAPWTLSVVITPQHRGAAQHESSLGLSLARHEAFFTTGSSTWTCLLKGQDTVWDLKVLDNQATVTDE